MSKDQSLADLLSAADPALMITDGELDRSRDRSLSFVNSDVTHIAVGGSVHAFHRSPAKRHWRRFASAGLAAAAVAACVLVVSSLVTGPVNTAAAPTVTATATPSDAGKAALAGPTVSDSFGNVDYYTTVSGDTPEGVAAAFRISVVKLAEFNGLQPGSALAPNTKLRLIPAPGPIGQTIFYTTVEGDSFDSIGYKFRCTTEQLLHYNPSLTADKPIPPGTRVSLIPGELKIDGAQGTFTTDADGIPQTYTTAPGDIERQISLRFRMPDLEWANRPLTGTDRVWYTFSDLPTGELAPGQTISLNLTKPLHK